LSRFADNGLGKNNRHILVSAITSSVENFGQELRWICQRLATLEGQLRPPTAQTFHYDHAIDFAELIAELRSLLGWLHVQSLSAYHTFAAIAEIARAGLARDYPGNPYLTSIEALAIKEDSHAMRISEQYALVEQLFAEIFPPPNDIGGLVQCLAHARQWIEYGLYAAPSTIDLQAATYHEEVLSHASD
jgi:hypothetical protein